MSEAVNKVTVIKWLISLCIPACFFLIPVTQDYTKELQIFFAITAFIILIVAFDLFELLIPSILLPTLYFLSGIVPVNVAFGSYANTTVWMILGALILADALAECGLLQRIAIECIRKFGGTFTGTVFGVYIAGAVISFVTFSQAFIIMMTLTYGICLAMKLQCSKYSALLCFAGMMGGITTCTFMYNPGYLALAEAGIRKIPQYSDFVVQWYDGFAFNGLYFFFFLAMLWVLTKLLKTNEVTFEGGPEYFHKEHERMGPMTAREKKGLVIVILLMIYLFTGPIHGYPAAYGFMTFPYMLFLPGINVGTYQCTKKTNFSIIFFIAGCLSIGVVSSALHAETLITNLVAPMLQGHGALVALLLMLTLGVVCNLFMTPYAMMAALSLPFAALATTINISPLTSVMTLMISSDMIFLPYEVAGCLLMYSFGLISIKHFIELYTSKTVLTYVFFVVVIYPLWKIMGFVNI